MPKPFRGIFSIPQSPFDELGSFLWDDFEREVDWIVRAGAHGIVWPVMASEFTVLSFPERVRSMRVAVEVVAGRVPVVIGVADVSQAGAVALSEEAAKAGADSVIAMPPWATKVEDRALVEAYYRAIAKASGLPVIVQNAGPPLGSSLPGPFVVELCERIELVQYLKEEKPPMGRSISEVLRLASPAVKGVFSGGQCRWLISDYQRGVCGSMPASHVTDIDVQIWNALEAGDLARAHEIYDRKIVLDNSLLNMGAGANKEVLRRRGALSVAATRSLGAAALDAQDLADIAYGMSLLEPYFTV